MKKALEYVIESMPVKHLNQVTFGENTKAESHINEFILRAYYQNDQKPRKRFLNKFCYYMSTVKPEM